MVQRRHAQEIATASERTSEAEYLLAEDAQPCSTSSSTKGSTPAFLARKGVLNARGQLMLKSLTYADLEQWCISVGVSHPSISALLTDIQCIESSAVALTVSASVTLWGSHV